MSKADQIVDKAATRLQALADKAAAEGGVTAKFAEPLADDAKFLRKLKPSLISKRRKPKRQSGPSPYLVLGVAFAAGILVAKLIDWRGDADPRD